MEIKRGQVWWWACPRHDRRHIQQGTRPVIVVSNDACNAASGVITVVPLTSSVKKPYPQQTPIILPDGVSVALADQITSIPVEELVNLECELRDFQMEQVDRAIAIQLGFLSPDSRSFKVTEDGPC